MTAFYSITCVILITCILQLVKYSQGERVLGKETDEFDFDGLPGAQHDFKIEIPPGREECFYQPTRQGANIHVSYEVLRGGDRLIDVFLKDPLHALIQAGVKTSEGNLEAPAQEPGTYSICIDNTSSRMYSKLVYIYIVSFITEEWQEYVGEIQAVSGTMLNFTTTVDAVQKSLELVTLHQATSRMQVMKDWYLITGNNTYIRNWSIAQIIIIVCTSIFTVSFVRRLFRVSTVTPTNKPRA